MTTATRKRAAKAKSAAKPTTARATPRAVVDGGDSTVIVTTDGKRVSRGVFNAVPKDETVIVTLDGKRVKRSDYQEN